MVYSVTQNGTFTVIMWVRGLLLPYIYERSFQPSRFLMASSSYLQFSSPVSFRSVIVIDSWDVELSSKRVKI